MKGLDKRKTDSLLFIVKIALKFFSSCFTTFYLGSISFLTGSGLNHIEQFLFSFQKLSLVLGHRFTFVVQVGEKEGKEACGVPNIPMHIITRKILLMFLMLLIKSYEILKLLQKIKL